MQFAVPFECITCNTLLLSGLVGNAAGYRGEGGRANTGSAPGHVKEQPASADGDMTTTPAAVASTRKRKNETRDAEQPEGSSAGGQRSVGGREQTSNGDGGAGSRAVKKEQDRKPAEGEGPGPAGRPLPATTIGVRCGRAVELLFASAANLARTFGKGEFNEDIRARAAAKAAGQPVQEGQDEEPPSGVGTQQAAATGEAQPQVSHQAGQPGPKKLDSSLNELHAVLMLALPNGELRTTMTEDMAADPVCLRQVELLEAALQCRMLQDRIAATNHAKAETYLEQRGGSGAAREPMGRQEAPSKVAQRECRAAFAQHIRPMMAGLDLSLCSDLPDRRWQSCVMRAGADACDAGGPCKRAREVLGWPEDLLCVDPSLVWPGKPWARRFFAWLVALGKVEAVPGSLLEQQRWALCMRACVPHMPPCLWYNNGTTLLHSVTRCSVHAASRRRRLDRSCVAALLALHLGGRCSQSLQRCLNWS